MKKERKQKKTPFLLFV